MSLCHLGVKEVLLEQACADANENLEDGTTTPLISEKCQSRTTISVVHLSELNPKRW